MGRGGGGGRRRWVRHGADAVLLELVRPQKVFVAKLFAANVAKRLRIDDAHLTQSFRREQRLLLLLLLR